MIWLLTLPRRLARLLRDTTGVRPIDTGELRALGKLLDHDERWGDPPGSD